MFYLYFVAARKSCLVLVSTSNGNLDSLHCKATGILSEILKQELNMEVHCNLWDHIKMHDPVEWTTENLLKYENIVLVCTPLGKTNWLKSVSDSKKLDVVDPYVMCTNALLKSAKQNRFQLCPFPRYHVIYFDNNPSCCIPDQVANLVTCLKLTQKFKHFARKLVRRSFAKVKETHFASLKEVTSEIQQNSKPEVISNLRLETANMQQEEVPLNMLNLGGVHDNTDKNSDVPLPINTRQDFTQEVSVLPTSYYEQDEPSCEGSECSCHSHNHETFEPGNFDDELATFEV